jgi:hypothetical protein
LINTLSTTETGNVFDHIQIELGMNADVAPAVVYRAGARLMRHRVP